MFIYLATGKIFRAELRTLLGAALRPIVAPDSPGYRRHVAAGDGGSSGGLGEGGAEGNTDSGSQWMTTLNEHELAGINLAKTIGELRSMAHRN